MTPAQRSALDSLAYEIDQLNATPWGHRLHDPRRDSVVLRAKEWRALKDEPVDKGLCLAVGPRGFRCTLSPHANAEHLADTDDGTVLCRWPMEIP